MNRISAGSILTTEDIQLSDSVRRVIFLAKYMAGVEKRTLVSLEDLKAGILREEKVPRCKTCQHEPNDSNANLWLAGQSTGGGFAVMDSPVNVCKNCRSVYLPAETQKEIK